MRLAGAECLGGATRDMGSLLRDVVGDGSVSYCGSLSLGANEGHPAVTLNTGEMSWSLSANINVAH